MDDEYAIRFKEEYNLIDYIKISSKTGALFKLSTITKMLFWDESSPSDAVIVTLYFPASPSSRR